MTNLTKGYGYNNFITNFFIFNSSYVSLYLSIRILTVPSLFRFLNNMKISFTKLEINTNKIINSVLSYTYYKYKPSMLRQSIMCQTFHRYLTDPIYLLH